MEVPIDAPEEIKEQVVDNLVKSHVIRRIERKIQFGMAVAIDEIEEANKKGLQHPNKPSKLCKKPARKVDKNEKEALRRILAFLEEKEMFYTLACLREEIGSTQRKRAKLSSGSNI